MVYRTERVLWLRLTPAITVEAPGCSRSGRSRSSEYNKLEGDCALIVSNILLSSASETFNVSVPSCVLDKDGPDCSSIAQEKSSSHIGHVDAVDPGGVMGRSEVPPGSRAQRFGSVICMLVVGARALDLRR